MSTERKTEPDEQPEGAPQVMQLPQSLQGSSGSLAESDDTSEKLGSKRHRTRFTPHQLSAMESAFAAERYPDMKARQELSEKLGLSEVQVQVWFQNKRAKSRRKDKRKRQEDSPTVTIIPPPFWPKDIPFDTNIVDFCKKTKRPSLSSPADNSSGSGGKTLGQPVPQVSHAEAQQITQPGTVLEQPHVEYQALHMESQTPSKLATTGFWLYENPPSEAQFSSSTSSYQSQPQATAEVFQGPTFLPFVQPEEELFPLESTVHFHSHRAVAYSQPQAGPSSSYGGAGSTTSPMLPPISTYDDTPPLQPPVMPTTHLPPNPYNQPPF